MEYKVYRISGLDNIVKYVGITKYSLTKRLYRHVYDSKNGITKNIHKIKWFNKNMNCINIELIEEVNNISDAFEREKYWISFYRNNGINLINKTNGGEGCYGYKHTIETIENMTGCNNHRWNKPNLINREKLGRKVEYSLDGENWILYSSIREASLKLNLGFRTIKNICEGNYTFLSYYFRYFGEEFKLNRPRKKNDQSIRKVKIEAFISGEWVLYESSRDASEILSLNRSKIVSVCSGKRLTTGGYRFRYYEKDKNVI
jgi:predicted GIY-YIG superfamily endonuclease